ncbi:MAG: alpha/beta fold hydrolase [Candidatus Woesearchaeota archaeon]
MYINSFDETRIWYDFSRQKKPVLIFIHGWVNNWTTWKKEIIFFQKKGYSILKLDLRGHGKSDKPEEHEKYGLEYFAKDIHEIIKKENIKKFILIGHSMGGMIALKYYELYKKEKKIKSLILCDTTYHKVIKNELMNSPFTQRIIEFMSSKKEWTKLRNPNGKIMDLSKFNKSADYFIFYEGLHNTSMSCVFSCLAEMMKFNLKKVLNTITEPTLILHGERDKLILKENSFELFQNIKNSHIEIIPEGTHFINVQNSELVDDLIFNFLNKNKI